MKENRILCSEIHFLLGICIVEKIHVKSQF